ncbi:MAG: hypothetical protein D6698_12885 [Gammaproteobacteria bacterium]|nr:MAG: hypothetical protein D6698_12885 [Gammaproteobacteria bacterium]
MNVLKKFSIIDENIMRTKESTMKYQVNYDFHTRHRQSMIRYELDSTPHGIRNSLLYLFLLSVLIVMVF